MIKFDFRRKQSALGFYSIRLTGNSNKRRLTSTLINVLFTFVGNAESTNNAKYIRYPKTLFKKERWKPHQFIMRFSHTTMERIKT